MGKLKCSICQYSTNDDKDIAFFGEWMKSNELTVHYFCLLLSTNLPQNGKDFSGILGFQLRDIRAEIRASAKRKCSFCSLPNATICCRGCKMYFHLVCGRRNYCLFEFFDEFKSYCSACMPLNKSQKKLLANPPATDLLCMICTAHMGAYNPTLWLYGACCGNGFAHRFCLQKYALAAGYYLTCIWCRKSDFRQHIRAQGIFVPDREAKWELEKGAFRDLHRGHSRCDMPQCVCPRGREYKSGKWLLILCSLCGAFGAHNPACLPGSNQSTPVLTEFKCATCAQTERDISKLEIENENLNSTQINLTLYMQKKNCSMFESTDGLESPTFSEAISESSSSLCTVVPICVNNETQKCSTASAHNTKQDGQNFEMLESSVANETQQTNRVQVATVSATEPNIKEEDWQTLEMLEFVDNECVGSCTYRINLLSPRFAGKSIGQISESPANFLTAADIIERINVCYETQQTSEVKVATASASATSASATLATTTTSSATSATATSTSALSVSATSSSATLASATKSSAHSMEDWQTLEILEFTNMECVGTCIFHINLLSPRFAGKTIGEISESPADFLTEADILERTNDCRFFPVIDEATKLFCENEINNFK